MSPSQSRKPRTRQQSQTPSQLTSRSNPASCSTDCVRREPLNAFASAPSVVRGQHRARSIEPLHHRRIIKALLLKSASTPRRWVAFDYQQTWRPRQTVQRPRYFPAAISASTSFFASARSSVIVTKQMRHRIVAFDPGDIHLRRLVEIFSAAPYRRVHDGGERKIIKISGTVAIAGALL